MAITITFAANQLDATGANITRAIGTITLSGNYPSGGETLDLSSAAALAGSTQQPLGVDIISQNANAGYYVPQKGSSLSNWKLRCFAAGGTELTAGAYPAAFTSDIIAVDVAFPKLQ